MTTIQAVKGFNDVLPSQSHKWQKMEATLIDILNRYGYSQIRLPLVEETEAVCSRCG